MQNTILVALILTVFLGAGSGYASAQGEAGNDKTKKSDADGGDKKGVKIKSIKLKGNKAIKTGDLERAIKTKTRNWFLWPVYYTEEKVAADVQKLRTIYYRRGFLNHRVEAQGKEHITFLIDEGPLYKVGEFSLRGNTIFDDETLLAELELESGQTYLQQKAEAHARRILKLYRENGYVDANVWQQPWFVPDANVVDVEFRITEGRQFRIGRVDITGNEQTQDKVIRRVLDEYDFVPGQLYNADLAPKQGGGELERYVQDLTMADEVIVKPVTPADGADGRKDVQVGIREGLTGMWSPGIAVGTDSGFIGQLVWEQRNFDVGDWPENFGDFLGMRAFKGAGQSLRVALQPGTVVSQYSVAFSEPYFRNKPISLNVVGSSWERWRESYDEQRTKGYVGFEKRYENYWRRSLGFRVENVNVGNLEIDAPQEIIDVKGNNILVGVKFGVGRDSTDHRYTPSRGYTLNVGYEQVTGDETFGILKGTWITYRTLHEDLLERKTVLATKVLAATTVDDAPAFEKFYAGGAGMYGISGFRYRGVSTRGLQTNVINPVRKDPIGSDWIFLASTEVAVPLIGENISALFFVDSGTIDTGSYRASAGTGIQIQIPWLLGQVPMRFEIATPFMKDDDAETKSFNFYMGRLY